MKTTSQAFYSLVTSISQFIYWNHELLSSIEEKFSLCSQGVLFVAIDWRQYCWLRDWFVLRGVITGRQPMGSYRWYADVIQRALRSLGLWLEPKEETCSIRKFINCCWALLTDVDRLPYQIDRYIDSNATPLLDHQGSLCKIVHEWMGECMSLSWEWWLIMVLLWGLSSPVCLVAHMPALPSVLWGNL